VTLQDLFGDDGLLRHPQLIEVDGAPLAVPWPATSQEIWIVLGSVSPSRRRLHAHLVGFVDWFNRAFSGDNERAVWLRGEFAATLRPEVEDLDLVVLYDGSGLTPGDSWLLRVLAAGPVNLYPGRISVTALRHDVSARYREDVIEESRRSMVRVQRPDDGEQVRTGWLRIASTEEVADG
jgi:hypothetical protein